MQPTLKRGLAVGIAAGAALSCTGVALAAGQSTTTPPANAPKGHCACHHLPRAAGMVVSDSATGGALNYGQMVIKEPDGAELTVNLTSRTKAKRYQGRGVKPVSESPGTIPANEVVILRGRLLRKTPLVGGILDLGFQAQS